MQLTDSCGLVEARQSPSKDRECSLTWCKHGASRGAVHIVCLRSHEGLTSGLVLIADITVQVLGPMWLLQQGGEYLPPVLGLWSATAVWSATAGLLAKRGAD